MLNTGMPVHKEFQDLFSNEQEQDLLKDLVDEMIATRGFDAYYIIANYKDLNEDRLLGENPNKSFDLAIPMAMYLITFDAFGGEGDMFSKFNIVVNDTLSLGVSVLEFEREVLENERAKSMLEAERPREQDLIYLPFNRRLYSVTFVEHEQPLYQGGDRQFWELKAALHTYGSESYNTGIPEIDDQAIEHAIPKRNNEENKDDFADDYGDRTMSDNMDLVEKGRDFIDNMGVMFDED